jgi:hypothetical protein
MSSKGVERIETAEGNDFDPNTQEAMTTVPAAEGKKPNTVANVWQVSRQRWWAMMLGAIVHVDRTLVLYVSYDVTPGLGLQVNVEMPSQVGKLSTAW